MNELVWFDNLTFIMDCLKRKKWKCLTNMYLNLWRFGQEYRGRVSFSYKGFWERLRERNHRSNGSMP